ncbi:MAG: hypothetical protein ACI4O9_00265 [Akkermansia sp.]
MVATAPMTSTASTLAPILPTAQPMAGELFLSTADAARVLCLSDRSVRNLIARGQLHAFRPCLGGRKCLLYAPEVFAYARAAQKHAHDAAMANVQRLRALIASRG